MLRHPEDGGADTALAIQGSSDHANAKERHRGVQIRADLSIHPSIQQVKGSLPSSSGKCKIQISAAKISNSKAGKKTHLHHDIYQYYVAQFLWLLIH